MNTRFDSTKGAMIPTSGQLSSYHHKSLSETRRLKTWCFWSTKFTHRQAIPIQYKFAPLNNHRHLKVLAFSNDNDDWSSDDDYEWDPAFEIEVPSDQRPVCAFFPFHFL